LKPLYVEVSGLLAPWIIVFQFGLGGDAFLPHVMGDQIKLQQVFSTLIMNARDSLDIFQRTGQDALF
jgi:hypothetical protein